MYHIFKTFLSYHSPNSADNLAPLTSIGIKIATKQFATEAKFVNLCKHFNQMLIFYHQLPKNQSK